VHSSKALVTKSSYEIVIFKE